MSEPTNEAPTLPFGLDRIVFFSDAVMAIAITLLVLELKAPEAGGNAVGELWTRLLALAPKYMGYLVSFWVIALYWVAHQRCFRYIRRFDRRLIFLNFLFLMFIAFLPFPTALLFSNAIVTPSVALYSAVAAAMGLSLDAVWLYAVRHGFVVPGIRPTLIRDISLNLLLPSAVFIASAGMAVLSPKVAMYAWLLLVPVYVVRRHNESMLLSDSLESQPSLQAPSSPSQHSAPRLSLHTKANRTAKKRAGR
jgi:uncharacterized membrane protein